MFYTIYRIINKINNKTYIGKHQTKNLDDGYMGSGKLIRRALEKYGLENFTKEILFVFETEQEMNDKEKELVVIGEESYNLCPGGQGGFGYINTHFSGEMKKIQYARQIFHDKMKNDDEFREKFAEKIKKASTKTVREKISKSLKKRYETIPGTFLGKKHTTETKSKIGQSNAKSQSGSKNSQYGTCWITKDKVNKKVSLEKLSIFENEGWKRGRYS